MNAATPLSTSLTYPYTGSVNQVPSILSVKGVPSTLLAFAEKCLETGQQIQRGSKVVFEQSLFTGCIEQYAIPLLEDVSGYKHGTDFSAHFRYGHKLASAQPVSARDTHGFDAYYGEHMKQAASITALEKLFLLRAEQRHTFKKSFFTELLREYGLTSRDTKVLIQGTCVKGASPQKQKAVLLALQHLADSFPNLEIHDPYLENEGVLQNLGLNLTMNFSGNYNVVLHLSDQAVFRFYNRTFYKEICTEEPLILNLSNMM